MAVAVDVAAPMQAALYARRQREGSVGPLLRHDDSAPSSRRAPGGADAYRLFVGQEPQAQAVRPPRPPCGGRPTSAPSGAPLASARAASAERRPSSGSREPPAAQEIPKRVPFVGAFRAPVRQRAQSAGRTRAASATPRSASCGPSPLPAAKAPAARQAVATPRERPASADRVAAVGAGYGVKEQHQEVNRAPRPESAGAFRKNERNVPKYLERVRRDINQEERAIAGHLARARGVSEDGTPLGQRRVPEDERQSMLASLESRRAALAAQHAKLPLRIETPGQRQRSNDVERELHDVEKNLDMLSKHRTLYVKV